MGELQIADVRSQVSFSLFTDFENFTVFKPGPHHEPAFTAMLDQLIAWSGALKTLRLQHDGWLAFIVPEGVACHSRQIERGTGMAERFVLYKPEQQIYHCGGFLDADSRRAYLYHSVQFARQGLVKSSIDVGDRKAWVIQRVEVDWELGDLVKFDVQEEMRPFGQ